MGGIEEIAGAGFEAEAAVLSAGCFGDDVVEEMGGDAFPEMRGRGAHRFNFGVLRVEFFECAAAHQFAGIGPHAPEGDVWLSEGVEVESVHAAGVGDGAQIGHMKMKEILDLRAAEVVDLDLHAFIELEQKGDSKRIARGWAA